MDPFRAFLLQMTHQLGDLHHNQTRPLIITEQK